MTKYGAKYVFWNNNSRTVISSEDANKLRSGKQNKLPEYIRRFDSRHEFKVYLELVRIYGYRRVRTQVSTSILPKGICFPRGKNWRIDFAITEFNSDYEYCVYVEAKGLITREFVYTLACLEAYKPSIFNNLALVFPNAIPVENSVIKNLNKSYLSDRLLTLKHLKNRTKPL